MAKEDSVHKIEMEYSYDRLWARKLSQVYQHLLPDGSSEQLLALGEIVGGNTDESSGDLRTGFFGKAERRENHREPDRSAA